MGPVGDEEPRRLFHDELLDLAVELCALRLVGSALAGAALAGWTVVLTVVLLLGGFQMVMLGILGEYVWRALDEARGRPRYLVERATPAPR